MELPYTAEELRFIIENVDYDIFQKVMSYYIG